MFHLVNGGYHTLMNTCPRAPVIRSQLHSNPFNVMLEVHAVPARRNSLYTHCHPLHNFHLQKFSFSWHDFPVNYHIFYLVTGKVFCDVS